MNKQKNSTRLLDAIPILCLVSALLFPSAVFAMNTENKNETKDTTISKGSVVNVPNTLQEAIDAASENDIISLSRDTTYTGDIIINKTLTLEGDGSQTIEGAISFQYPLTMKNIKVEHGIFGTASLSLEGCTVTSGGIEITDNNGTNNVTILDSNLFYNNTTTAISITGSPDSDKYSIGGNGNNAPNTFINNGDTDASVIAWPAGSKQLYAGKNYWKIKNKDALYHEIKVIGDVRYYERMNIPAIHIPNHFKFIPPKGAAFEKGGTNTATDYIQAGDYINFLYNRSFSSAGLPILNINEFMVDSLIDKTKLPKEYRVKCTSGIFKDNNLGVPFTSAELESKIFIEGQNLFLGIWNPMLPMDVTPKNMVSYAGTTDTLDDTFPKVHYDFATPNTLWLPNVPATGPEFYTYQQQTVTFQGMNLPILGGYLANEGKYYESWIDSDPSIDPDNDFLPFSEGFSINGTPASANQGGQYNIEITNRDNISKIGFYNFFADTAGITWKTPWTSLGHFSPSSNNPVDFYSNFQTGTMTVRPTSGDLSVEPVVDNMPTNPYKPTAVINKGAVYQDSTGQNLAMATVSLLNDNKEPTEAIYQKMLAIANSNSATKGKTLEHHYLSLLNVSDGNNVVTTNASKTVYIPYPINYKTGTPITLLHFDDYNRMPNETVDGMNTTVISDVDITKLEEGFTFTTTGNMGAYIVAYEKKSSPITPEPPVAPDTPSTPKPPHTGENKNLPWNLMAVCSVLTLMFIYSKSKDSNKVNK